MKFGQLIDYNMRTYLLKNDTQNVVEKLVPDSFLKNKNWVLRFIQCVFIDAKLRLNWN